MVLVCLGTTAPFLENINELGENDEEQENKAGARALGELQTSMNTHLEFYSYSVLLLHSHLSQWARRIWFTMTRKTSCRGRQECTERCCQGQQSTQRNLVCHGGQGE